jgi:hypothetical protein
MINQVFENLDQWRGLPSYQLERRADVFFSLYLQEILETHIQPETRLHPVFIPEFPLHIKFVSGKKTDDRNHSFKIDFVAISADMNKVFFVELKTDEGSTRSQQDAYLLDAKSKGMDEIVASVVDLFHASGSKKRKYARLLAMMQTMGLFEQGDDSVADFVQEVLAGQRQSWRGITERVKKLRVSETCKSMTQEIVYIKPAQTSPSPEASVISFKQIIDQVLSVKQDPFSVRFATSLQSWGENPV